MFKKAAFLVLLVLPFVACDKNDDDQAQQNTPVSVGFLHSFYEDAVDSSNFNTIQYTNGFGTSLSITRLRYLISQVSFTNQDGIKTIVKDYHLVDLSQDNSLTINDILLPPGAYNLKMRFGFTEATNTSSIYPDLNAASWNVPENLGGGYHYMQLEGRWLDPGDAPDEPYLYAYHTISAVQNPGPENTREDTSIEIDLGEITVTQGATQINVNMHIDQWFENPNLWNLSELNGLLMGNYTAQKMMQENGQNVFSLASNMGD